MLAILATAVAARPVAVMIHGAGGGGWEYDTWKPVFQRAGWDVVARDLVPVKGDLTKTKLDDYVRQVQNWCPKNRPFVLIGASMGGALALKVAVKTKPTAVVLINSVPAVGTGSKKYPAVVKWAGGPIEESRAAMPDSDERTVRKAWKRWRDESGAVMTELSRGYALPQLKCPSLVVIGDKDTDIPPAASHKLAGTLKSDVFWYAGMSHVGPLLGKRGAEVASTVVQWLGTVRRSRA